MSRVRITDRFTNRKNKHAGVIRMIFFEIDVILDTLIKWIERTNDSLFFITYLPQILLKQYFKVLLLFYMEILKSSNERYELKR